MPPRNQALELLADPLLPLNVLAENLGVTTRFLRAEAKRNRLKIVKLTPRLIRVHTSEAARYKKERVDG